MTTFHKHAEFVRQSFFPKWDRQRRWQFVHVHDLNGNQGSCDRAARTISILKGGGGDGLPVLLIHEICHAVTTPHHGKRWRQRMEVAAEQADGLNMAVVADMLRKEVAAYEDAIRVTATLVYGGIADAVVDGNTDFLAVVDFVRRDYGMSRSEFLKRFRRAEKVFDEAVQEAKVEAQTKARMRAELSLATGLGL